MAIYRSVEAVMGFPLFGNTGRVADQGRKKTTLIAMIRNEKGILEIFCAHALSLFDRIILIDHLSSDGSREYIKFLSEKYPNIECYFFFAPGIPGRPNQGIGLARRDDIFSFQRDIKSGGEN